MKKLNVTVYCNAIYNSHIMVPDDLSLEDAIEYARDNINDIELTELEFIPGEEEIDEFNCFFDDTPIPCKESCASLVNDLGIGYCVMKHGNRVGTMYDIMQGRCKCIFEE